MSYFDVAYEKTMGHEGGYVNDPDDAGGETYKGISRKYNPSWVGWRTIDIYKTEPDFPETLDMSGELQHQVKELYKQMYFDPYRGDDMPEALAIEMFDTAVNMGIGRAIRFLQSSLNLLNRNGAIFPDMVEDGAYGPTTHKCLMKYLRGDRLDILLKFMNVFQGYHYIEYMRKSPTQEKYARGWFNRVEISK